MATPVDPVHLRAPMGDPTPPVTTLPDNEDHIPILEESNGDLRTTSEEVIPLAEETASVHKREVVTGGSVFKPSPIPSKNSSGSICSARPSRSPACRSTASARPRPTSEWKAI